MRKTFIEWVKYFNKNKVAEPNYEVSYIAELPKPDYSFRISEGKELMKKVNL